MFVTKFLSQENLLMDMVDDGSGSSSLIDDNELIDISKLKTNTEPQVNEPPIEPPANEPPANEPPKEPTTNSTGDVVMIDDGTGAKEYILDENGNATLEGNIVFTKEQLEESSGDNTGEVIDSNIHKLISEVSGLDLIDENGNPIEFKQGIEGLAQREVLIKNKFYEQGLQEASVKFFNDNPDVYDIYSYKQKHGSLEGYTKQVDYAEYSITEETSTDELKSILREQLVAQGNDVKTAEKLIRLSEQDETLRVDALEALEKLKQSNNTRLAQVKLQEEQEEREAVERYENYYGVTYTKDNKLVDKGVKGSVYDKLVKEGKVGNIFIPQEGLIVTKPDGAKTKVGRMDLFNYFYKPVAEQNGTYYTQSQIDENNRLKDTDNYLIQGIRNITGGDISSLEKTMQNIIRLKDAKKIINMSNRQSNQTGSLSKEEIAKQLKSGKAQIIIT